MSIVNVKYTEILERTIAVNVPDNLTDDQKIAQAIEIGKRHYFAENVILGGDDLSERFINTEYKKNVSEREAF